MRHIGLHSAGFSVTLFTSAFLLFLIQPLFSKMILPLLGGSAHVWITAMMFFQLMLVLGYAYAHLITYYLNLRQQAFFQLAPMVVALTLLPFDIPDNWISSQTEIPVLWQLKVMLICTGLPFFCIASLTPLLQHWFANTQSRRSSDPYFLYAASNAGSLLGLLSYPFIIQPLSTIAQQAWGWAFLYGVLIVCVLGCLAFIYNIRHTLKTSQPPENTGPMSWNRQGVWLLLAFVPSSLMLGVTSFITNELGAVPLLWVIPLSLYVSTYLIAFSQKSLVFRRYVYFGQAVMVALVTLNAMSGGSFNSAGVMLMHLALFFLTALACHQELYLLRPHAARLTHFYMIMSIGGALGGIFNAVIAPQIFIVTLEYALVLSVAMLVRYISDQPLRDGYRAIHQYVQGRDRRLSGRIFALIVVSVMTLVGTYTAEPSVQLLAILITGACLLYLYQSRWLFSGAVVCLIAANPFVYWSENQNYIYFERNYYGAFRIAEAAGYHYYMNGTILHSAQARHPEYRDIPVSYFHPETGVGNVFEWLDEQPYPQHVGALGLGTGALVCYAHPQRHFTFYEIDKDVVQIARNPEYFSYLSECGNKTRIQIGDGRLRMRKAQDEQYNLIFLDAFTSQSIPLHLITRDAFGMYKRKLTNQGIIVVNITTQYYNLRFEIAAIARDLNMNLLHKHTSPGQGDEHGLKKDRAHYAVLTQNRDQYNYFSDRGWKPVNVDNDMRAWRDDYINVLRAVRWQNFIEFRGFNEHLQFD